VGVDRPTELIPQLANTPSAFGDLGHIVDLFSVYHFANIGFEKRRDPVACRPWASPNGIGLFPDHCSVLVGLDRLEPVSA
jgi:hypothetical protein